MNTVFQVLALKEDLQTFFAGEGRKCSSLQAYWTMSSCRAGSRPLPLLYLVSESGLPTCKEEEERALSEVCDPFHTVLGGRYLNSPHPASF